MFAGGQPCYESRACFQSVRETTLGRTVRCIAGLCMEKCPRGERAGTRTPNLVIKSHLLYQLSYAPTAGLSSTKPSPPGEANRLRRFRIPR